MGSIWEKIAVADQEFDAVRVLELIYALITKGYSLHRIEIEMRMSGMNTHLISCGHELPKDRYITDKHNRYLKITCKSKDIALSDVMRYNETYERNFKLLSDTGLLTV
jgi:hypothetical protein